MTDSRRALVIGINYFGSRHQLGGCINDAERMQRVLVDRGYAVRLLRDDDPKHMPTAARIVRELAALVAWTRGGPPGRRVVVHFSGHGTHTFDRSGDETDGQDELIVPCDAERAGCISDDTLSMVLAGISPAAQAFFVFDCCHSGSVLDLPHVYGKGRVTPSRGSPAHYPARVIMLSGCRDDQTSADAYNLLGKGKWAGALTTSLLAALDDLELQSSLTAGNLLRAVREHISHGHFAQVPQMSCSWAIDPESSLDFFEKPR